MDVTDDNPVVKKLKEIFPEHPSAIIRHTVCENINNTSTPLPSDLDPDASFDAVLARCVETLLSHEEPFANGTDLDYSANKEPIIINDDGPDPAYNVRNAGKGGCFGGPNDLGTPDIWPNWNFATRRSETSSTSSLDSSLSSSAESSTASSSSGTGPYCFHNGTFADQTVPVPQNYTVINTSYREETKIDLTTTSSESGSDGSNFVFDDDDIDQDLQKIEGIENGFTNSNKGRKRDSNAGAAEYTQTFGDFSRHSTQSVPVIHYPAVNGTHGTENSSKDMGVKETVVDKTGHESHTQVGFQTANRLDAPAQQSIVVNPTLGQANVTNFVVDSEKNKVDTNTEEDAFNTVLSVVPDVDEDYAKKLMQTYKGYPPDMLATIICTQLLDSKNYPKKIVELPKPKPEQVNTTPTSSNVSLKPIDWEYAVQAEKVLQDCFKTVAQCEITKALRKCNRQFTAALLHLKTRLEQTTSGTTGIEKPIILLRRPRRRPTNVRDEDLHPRLKEELQHLKQENKIAAEKEDFSLAQKLNNEEYEKEGQLIECGCCFGEYPFEDMVQCLEGHLFCAECLKRYVQEAVFGSSRSAVVCMTDGCGVSFLKSHLKKCLPSNLMEKYEEREQEEALKLAGLKDLVRCPGCDYAAEIPPDEKVFKCLNESCLKETCRYCKTDWEEHFGLPCAEVEKQSQKNVRLTYEEKMTNAKVRICPTCNCSFMKTDGCNKMTCRCGASMCYICRTPKIAYGHFCNHLREPGHVCTKCTRCSLWTDPTEDDDRAIREIKKEAKQQQKRLAEEENVTLTSNTEIGPSLSPPHPPHAKKKRRHMHYFH